LRSRIADGWGVAVLVEYDRSTLVVQQKTFAMVGLWTASANLVFFLVIAFYPHEMDENSLGPVLVVGWLLSLATIIFFGAGHGKGGWIAPPRQSPLAHWR
jgi:cell division protein FtsW (lipid II flippase)